MLLILAHTHFYALFSLPHFLFLYIFIALETPPLPFLLRPPFALTKYYFLFFSILCKIERNVIIG
ncbi:hypothetical protein BCR43DRAFT_490733 [Syncephalastrum racemosum]|uniref:Uncharacterized protein n=1 Tax=Syncephalastrum racemosum TaxID=13706 RepID=A0A1X2HGI8_SYNRA|nr:hypothetical protein BCR43DRAFT_490733 [Syncephalastrum racemosum]